MMISNVDSGSFITALFLSRSFRRPAYFSIRQHMLVDLWKNISIIRKMKEFKVRKIEQNRSRSKYKAWRKLTGIFGHKGAIGIMAVLGLGIIFWGGSAVIDSGFFVEKTRQIFSFGPLEKDKNGHTNVLLLGVAGEGSEGGNLSDSIMVVSVNPSTPSVSMLSLPRDLFLSSRIGDRKVIGKC